MNCFECEHFVEYFENKSKRQWSQQTGTGYCSKYKKTVIVTETPPECQPQMKDTKGKEWERTRTGFKTKRGKEVSFLARRRKE